jgi:hypothetical protein
VTDKFVRILFAFWVMLIVSLSLVPLKVKFHLGTTGRWHNAGHLFMFFVATFLACRMVNNVYSKLTGCVALVGVAFTMEWVEKVSYHIPYEWRDVRFDCTGILCGILLLLLPPVASSSGIKRAVEVAPAEPTVSKIQ